MAENKRGLTDEEVEAEIKRLNETMEEIIDLLRSCDNPIQAAEFALDLLKSFQALGALEKRGKELMAAGITREMLEAMFAEDEEP